MTLSKGWTETTFGDVVENVPITHKKLPKRQYEETGRFPVVDQGQQFIGGYSDDEEKVIDEDLPLLVFGDHTRAFKYLNEPFIPGADGIKVLKPMGVDPKWLYQIAHAVEFPDKGYSRHFQHLKKARLLVPSPDEQRRIVSEIEKQFTRLDAGVEGLKRVQVNLKRYRASVLKAACSGELVPTEAELHKVGRGVPPSRSPETAHSESSPYPFETGEQLLERILIERRKAHEEQQKNAKRKSKYKEPAAPDTDDFYQIPKGWCWTSLEAIADVIDPNPSHRMPKYVAEGVPFISSENFVGTEGIDFGIGKKVSSETLEKQRSLFTVEEGDFVLSRIGTIGKTRFLPVGKDYCLSHALVVIKVHSKSINKRWLRKVVAADSTILQAHKKIQSVGVPDLGMGKIRSFAIPLPPLAEQKRIVEEVERRLSVIEEMEAAVEASLKRANRLRQSILKKAFEGELA